MDKYYTLDETLVDCILPYDKQDRKSEYFMTFNSFITKARKLQAKLSLLGMSLGNQIGIRDLFIVSRKADKLSDGVISLNSGKIIIESKCDQSIISRKSTDLTGIMRMFTRKEDFIYNGDGTLLNIVDYPSEISYSGSIDEFIYGFNTKDGIYFVDKNGLFEYTYKTPDRCFAYTIHKLDKCVVCLMVNGDPLEIRLNQFQPIKQKRYGLNYLIEHSIEYNSNNDYLKIMLGGD